jgi:ATP adenylyltransferase
VTSERLWTPWRMAYIRQGTREDGACVLCELAARDDDAANHVLGRGEHVFALLNAFPYNPGHLMVAPLRHVGEYGELTPEELGEMMAMTGTAIAAIQAESGAHGFNLGMNLGQVAGAGIADHLHLHLVPRWGGDTNFMPIVAQTKVLPELLDETYEKLSPHFAKRD